MMKTALEIFNDRFTEKDTPDGLFLIPEYCISLQDEIIAAMQEYATQSNEVVTRDDIERDLWTFRKDAMSWIDDLDSYKIFEQQLLKIINALSRKPSDGLVKVEDISRFIDEHSDSIMSNCDLSPSSVDMQIGAVRTLRRLHAFVTSLPPTPQQ